MQYNFQKSSNFQGLSHFSRIFGKNDKIPGFFQAGKTVTIFPGFPGAVGTLGVDHHMSVETRKVSSFPTFSYTSLADGLSTEIVLSLSFYRI